MFLAANNTGILSATPAERRGAASGLLGLSRNLGLVTGASVLAALFAAASGVAEVAQASPEALTSALRVTFLATAALLVAATLLAVATGHRTSKSRRAMPQATAR
ncbi:MULTISPECIES: hypothetical protein [unclassified Microbacterium]|uniref:hypothetical protein n=1 Tax=unclassified Microbacterium TaxID=2609290 RepID=UPI0030176590